MVWNYHDNDSIGKTSQIELTVNGIAGKKVMSRHYRIDQHFSNSFEKWKAMGKSQNVTADQYQQLEKAGQLQLYNSPEWKEIKDGKGIIKI
jgi:xylan 1,4-beta-xylosidase